MTLYFDTCVLPRSHLETARLYRGLYGPSLGIELLPMFDLPGWERNLRRNLPLLQEGPLYFHEPVFGVEHTAPEGSPAWEASMYHLRLTAKYAQILHPEIMVYHLNNHPVPEDRRDEALRITLENRDKLRGMFPDVRLVTENTGSRRDGTQLLDQQEFTDLARDGHWDVLVDVGHANLNGWDLPRLIDDLKDNIRAFHLHNNDGKHDLHNRIGIGTLDFPALIRKIAATVPDAGLVVEYVRPTLHGVALAQDLAEVTNLYRSCTAD